LRVELVDLGDSILERELACRAGLDEFFDIGPPLSRIVELRRQAFDIGHGQVDLRL
jgi:hypothetical protein